MFTALNAFKLLLFEDEMETEREKTKILEDLESASGVLLAAAAELETARTFMKDDSLSPESRKRRMQDHIQNALWGLEGIEKQIETLLFKMRPELKQ